MGNALAQVNQLDIFRFDTRARVGAILGWGRSEATRFIPFVGYGFRYVSLERDAFSSEKLSRGGRAGLLYVF